MSVNHLYDTNILFYKASLRINSFSNPLQHGLTMILFLSSKDAKVNLPYDTFLFNAVITLYGGELLGMKRVRISLNGAFTVYPPAQIHSLNPSEINLEDIEVITYDLQAI